jgi:hypothetical protein
MICALRRTGRRLAQGVFPLLGARGLLNCLCLGASVYSLPALTNESFEAHGTLSVEYYTGKRDPAPDKHFDVFSSGCTALIRTAGETEHHIDYFEFGTSDDHSYFEIKFLQVPTTNVYRVVNGKLIKMNLPRPIVPVNAANLRLDSLTTPPPMRGVITPVWLAYVSGCYFQEARINLTNSLLLGSTPSTEHFAIEAEWKWRSEARASISSYAEFLVDNGAKQIGNGKNGAKTTNGIFNVLEWTNSSGKELASRFELVLYELGDSDAKPLVSRKLAKVEGHLESLESPVRDFPTLLGESHKAPYAVRVEDRRTIDTASRRPRVIHYTALDGTIKGTTELMTNASAIEHSQVRPLLKGRRLARACLLVALVVGPIAFLSYRLLRSINNINAQQKG